MIDWKKIAESGDEAELKKAAAWLLKEQARLNQEEQDLKESREKFQKERLKYKDELEALNRQTVIERKRLREESMFFDTKMKILTAGFEKLEADRKLFEKEKKEFYYNHEPVERIIYETVPGESDDIAKRLFQNVNDPLALRKRYRDLVKIFHPDNLFGDGELIAQINKEFFRRKKEE